MNTKVTATITRNLKDVKENSLTIVDVEGIPHTFPIGPVINIQTDGQRLMFFVEIPQHVMKTDQELSARFVRALASF